MKCFSYFAPYTCQITVSRSQKPSELTPLFNIVLTENYVAPFFLQQEAIRLFQFLSKLTFDADHKFYYAHYFQKKKNQLNLDIQANTLMTPNLLRYLLFVRGLPSATRQIVCPYLNTNKKTRIAICVSLSFFICK